MTLTYAQIFQLLIFFCTGLFGMLLHWAKRFARKQTSLNLRAYLTANRSYTIMSVATYVAMFVTMVTSGVDFSTIQSLGNVFGAGYMIDSMLNKDET